MAFIKVAEWFLNTKNSDKKIVSFYKDKVFSFLETKENLEFLVHKIQNTFPSENRICLHLSNCYLFTLCLYALLILKKEIILVPSLKEQQLLDLSDNFDGFIVDSVLTLDKKSIYITLDNLLKNDKGNRWQDSLSDYRKLDFNKPFEVYESKIMLFTSGSTGQSKKIVKSVKNFEDEAFYNYQSFFKDIDSNKTTIIASVFPYHMYGLTFRVFSTMCANFCFDSDVIHYTEQLLALKHKEKDYIFISSPAFLSRYDFSLGTVKLKMLFSAGGAIANSTVLKFYECFKVYLTEIYGSTETGVIASRINKGLSSDYFILQDYVKITFKQDNFYLNSLIVDDEILLDDKLCFINERAFKLLGRKDNIIKIDEKRISLNFVEEKLKALLYVKDVAIVPLYSKNRTILGAVLVLDKTLLDKVHQKEIILSRYFYNELHHVLDSCFIPKKFRVVDRINVNHLGKRVLADLRELFND